MHIVFITEPGIASQANTTHFPCTAFFLLSTLHYILLKMAKTFPEFLSYLAILSMLFAPSLCDQATETAPSCSTVISNVAACLPFISHTSPSPSGICCGGVKNVAGLAKTHDDKMAICNCLKTNLANIQYDPALVAALPKQCSVNINLPPISKNTDCSK